MILGPIDQKQTDAPPEDASPSTEKVYQDEDGHWVITDVKGLKLGVRWRIDSKGYDIVRSESWPRRRDSRARWAYLMTDNV